MNELVLPAQLDGSFKTSSMDVMIDHVVSAVQNTERPVLFNLGFDPGWESLRSEFQAKAVKSDKDFGYVDRFIARNPSMFDVSSTEDFVALMHIMSLQSPERRKDICVGFNGDIRRWDDFIIDTDQKMIRLFKHMKMNSVFTTNMNNSSRLGDFPRLFWFDPIREGKDPSQVIFPKSHPMAERSQTELHGRSRNGQDSKLLIGLQANTMGASAELRSRINLTNGFALIASPYIGKVSDMKRAEDDVFETHMSTVVTRANIDTNIDRPEQVAFVNDALTFDAAE